MNRDRHLDAILTSPDDDAPRMVYADHLQEQGEVARGELIVVQCEMAKLPPWSRRRVELLKRERKLLDAHAAEWTAGLAGREDAGQPLFRWRWRRGFVEGVHTSDVPLLLQSEHILESVPLLREVELGSTNSAKDFPAFLASPFAARLRRLTLEVGLTASSPTYMPARLAPQTETAVALAECEGLRGLKELELHLRVLTADEVDTISASVNLAGLQKLTLGGNSIRDEGISALLAGRMRLKSVGLRDEDIRAEGCEALGTARTVEELDLSRNFRIGAKGAAMLAMEGACPALTDLDLSGCEIGDKGAEALAAASPPNLCALRLQSNGLGDRGGEAIAKSERLMSLELLDLRYHRMDRAVRLLRTRFGERVLL